MTKRSVPGKTAGRRTTDRQTIGGVTVECVQGNIAAQSGIDAVVNAANSALMPGGGVAGAIHRAAGPGLYDECRKLAPIKPGQAVITGAHDLPNKFVIHTLGPVYGRDEPAAELLAACYRNSLRLAEENRLTSIAFPAISTGVFGYPVEEAAWVAIKAIAAEAPRLSSLKRIRFVLFGAADHKLHAEVLAGVAAEMGER
jgi:O-acetyl-ADP-ribose deacetylase (regulator of RNase III)